MAETPIDSGKIIQKPPTTIDPRFFTPPGVIDVREGTGSDTTFSDADQRSVEDERSVQQPSESGAETMRLKTPGYITVIEQDIRFTPDGRQVVDVVLEVQDVAGATNYDVRVTKA